MATIILLFVVNRSKNRNHLSSLSCQNNHHLSIYFCDFRYLTKIHSQDWQITALVFLGLIYQRRRPKMRDLMDRRYSVCQFLDFWVTCYPCFYKNESQISYRIGFIRILLFLQLSSCFYKCFLSSSHFNSSCFKYLNSS